LLLELGRHKGGAQTCWRNTLSSAPELQVERNRGSRESGTAVLLGTWSRLRTVNRTLVDVLSVVGERWTLLVVREVSLGLRRFAEIQSATGAPRAVIADRLRRLTEADILTRRQYQVPGSRSRNEYVLTEVGLELVVVLAALTDWGERNLAPGAGPDIVYCHRACGQRLSAQLVCECGDHVDRVDLQRGLVASVNR
jgi:DNA-binding HxlR family transcriptional regulator